MTFETIKSMLTMDAVARHYGYTPNRAGFLRCPFHDDKTPSMKLYRDGFHCFGCGAHGDAIDYVGRLFGLSPLEAAGRLNDDFRLGLSMSGEPPDPDSKRQWQREQEAKRLFCEWKTDFLTLLDAAIFAANNADFANLTDGQVIAIQWREYHEYLSDLLMHGNIESQMSVFRGREEVVKRCQMILLNMSKRSTAA